MVSFLLVHDTVVAGVFSKALLVRTWSHLHINKMPMTINDIKTLFYSDAATLNHKLLTYLFVPKQPIEQTTRVSWYQKNYSHPTLMGFIQYSESAQFPPLAQNPHVDFSITQRTVTLSSTNSRLEKELMCV